MIYIGSGGLGSPSASAPAHSSYPTATPLSPSGLVVTDLSIQLILERDGVWTVSGTVLAATDLRVRRGSSDVIAGLSLTVRDGETVLIQGKSGSGKSTLFEVFGLLSDCSSGELHIDGVDVRDLSRRERALFRRDRLGMVYQDFQLVPDLTARENARLHKVTGADTILHGWRRSSSAWRSAGSAISIPLRCRVAKNSGSRSPVRSPTSPGSSSPTNPPGNSTRKRPIASSRCCSRPRNSRGRRC